MHVFYFLWYTKRHVLDPSNVELWKNQVHSISHFRVTLVWRHQLVFRRNLSKAFQVVLKACVSSIVCNQYCEGIMKVLWVWFLINNFWWENPNLHDPYYTVLPYCMIIVFKPCLVSRDCSLKNRVCVCPCPHLWGDIKLSNGIMWGDKDWVNLLPCLYGSCSWWWVYIIGGHGRRNEVCHRNPSNKTKVTLYKLFISV